MEENSRYNSPEIEAGLDIDLLFNSITESILYEEKSKSLKGFRSNDINEFSKILQESQEIFSNIIDILKKHPVENHQYLWIYLISIISSHILELKTYYVNTFQDTPASDEDISVHLLVVANLKKESEHLDRISYQFFNHKDFKVEQFLKSSKISTKLFNLVIQLLQIIVIDQTSDVQLSNNTFNALDHIDNFIKLLYSFLSGLDKTKKIQYIYKSFSMLTHYIKAIYYSGSSHLLKSFFEPENYFIHPKLGIEVINNGSVNFIDIINFYRYTAFNLLIISLDDEKKILSNYNIEANNYFIALFNIPNLSTESYVTWEDKNIIKDRIVNHIERQEISLMYILNYLLKLTNLTQLVKCQKYFVNELSYLISSLSASLSSDIRTASISGMSSSSYSISQMQFNHQGSTLSVNGDISFNFLSSIITNGSYKEKHQFIVKFCELFNQRQLNIPRIVKEFSLESIQETSFFHVYSMIEGSKYPGKITYVKAINKITKLLILLSIKYLFSTGGVNEYDERYLRKIFNLKSPIFTSLEVKDLISYSTYKDDMGNTIIKFGQLSTISNDKDISIANQLRICEMSNDLEYMTNTIKMSSLPY